MSKERLKEIKHRLVLLYNAADVDDETKDYIFKDLKVEWLIEQAERVQELEELEQEYIELNNDFTKLALENKRYRKKIQVALDISKKGSRDDIRVSNMQYVLNEALEGIVNE